MTAAINKIEITKKLLPDFIITLLLLKFCLSALSDFQVITNWKLYEYIMLLTSLLQEGCLPRSGGTCLESSIPGHAGSLLFASYADDCLGQVSNAGVAV